MNSGGNWYQCPKTRGNPQVHGRGCRPYVDGNPKNKVNLLSGTREVMCSAYAVNYDSSKGPQRMGMCL